MVGDEFGNQFVQARISWRRHPCGGPVSSAFAVAMMFAPEPARSLSGSPGADADCGLHRRHLEDGGSCVGFEFVDSRCSFLLRRLSRVGVPDLEFDGVSGVFPRSDLFNDNSFAFGEPPWRYAKLYIRDRATSNSGVKVIRHCFLWWLLWWCQRQVTSIGFKLRGFFSLDCNFISCLVFLCALLSFQFCMCTWLVL